MSYSHLQTATGSLPQLAQLVVRPRSSPLAALKLKWSQRGRAWRKGKRWKGMERRGSEMEGVPLISYLHVYAIAAAETV